MKSPLVTMVVLVCSACVLVSSAAAQVRTGVMHPTYGSRHGYTLHEHAMDHAHLMYHYARTRPAVPREVVVVHTQAVRSNIQAAGKVNEGLAKAVSDDQDATAILAKIKQHQAEAAKILQTLEKETKSESVDSETVAKHSKQLYLEIQKAVAEHKKLHDHLGGEELTKIE